MENNYLGSSDVPGASDDQTEKISTETLLFTAKNEIIINSKAEPIQSVYI